MIDESFSQGQSYLHRSDPRIKLVGMAVLALVLALTASLTAAATGLVLAAGLVLSSRLLLPAVGRRVLLVNLFIVLLWLLVPFSVPGPALFEFGGLRASVPGVTLAALVTLKANAIVLLMMALLATSHAAALGYALTALGVPKRLGYLLLFSYRYIFVMTDEFQRMQRAARLRCFRPRTNLLTWRVLGWSLGMTLVRAWNRAERVRQAMALRAFSGELRSPWALRCRTADRILLAALLGMALSLWWIGFVQGSSL